MGKRIVRDTHFGPRTLGQPTRHAPGSVGKVDVLIARLAAKVQLWHTNDAKIDPEAAAGGVYSGVSNGWAWENDDEDLEDRPVIAEPAGWRGPRSAFGLRPGQTPPRPEIVCQAQSCAMAETTTPMGI